MSLSFTHKYWAVYASLSGRRSDSQIQDAAREDFRSNLGRSLLGGVFQMAAHPADAIARCLFERMSDGTLFYHTPLHVLSMLGFAQDHGIALEPWQQLCIWFHDAIYVPSAKAGENEHSSALFMHALLRAYLPADVLSQAEAGIEATALYHSPDVDPAFHVILDLDLCNFAWDREGYRAASDDVAREMIPVHGKDKYPLGRKKFLTDMLAKQSIYRTDVFRANFEALARANVGQSLLDLDSGASGLSA